MGQMDVLVAAASLCLWADNPNLDDRPILEAGHAAPTNSIGRLDRIF